MPDFPSDLSLGDAAHLPIACRIQHREDVVRMLLDLMNAQGQRVRSAC
jgi:hypothetical protein